MDTRTFIIFILFANAAILVCASYIRAPAFVSLPQIEIVIQDDLSNLKSIGGWIDHGPPEGPFERIYFTGQNKQSTILREKK